MGSNVSSMSYNPVFALLFSLPEEFSYCKFFFVKGHYAAAKKKLASCWFLIISENFCKILPQKTLGPKEAKRHFLKKNHTDCARVCAKLYWLSAKIASGNLFLQTELPEDCPSIAPTMGNSLPVIGASSLSAGVARSQGYSKNFWIRKYGVLNHISETY